MYYTKWPSEPRLDGVGVMVQHLGSETCSQGTKSIHSEGGPQPESWTGGSSEPKIQGKFRVVGKLEQKTRKADRSVFHRHARADMARWV